MHTKYYYTLTSVCHLDQTSRYSATFSSSFETSTDPRRRPVECYLKEKTTPWLVSISQTTTAAAAAYYHCCNCYSYVQAHQQRR
jgi:hypothetical protein